MVLLFKERNGHKERHINYYRGVGAYTMYYANITVALTNVCKIKTASIRGEPEKHDCAEDIHLRHNVCKFI